MGVRWFLKVKPDVRLVHAGKHLPGVGGLELGGPHAGYVPQVPLEQQWDVVVQRNYMFFHDILFDYSLLHVDSFLPLPLVVGVGQVKARARRLLAQPPTVLEGDLRRLSFFEEGIAHIPNVLAPTLTCCPLANPSPSSLTTKKSLWSLVCMAEATGAGAPSTSTDTEVKVRPLECFKFLIERMRNSKIWWYTTNTLIFHKCDIVGPLLCRLEFDHRPPEEGGPVQRGHLLWEENITQVWFLKKIKNYTLRYILSLPLGTLWEEDASGGGRRTLATGPRRHQDPNLSHWGSIFWFKRVGKLGELFFTIYSMWYFTFVPQNFPVSQLGKKWREILLR